MPSPKRGPSLGYVNEGFSSFRDGDPGLELETVDLNDRSDDSDYHSAAGGASSRNNGSSNPAFQSDDGISSMYNSSSGDVTFSVAGSPTGDRGDHEEAHAQEDPGARCGLMMMRPRWLQRFRTAKWALFWLCWTGALQGMVVNGFVNVVITTIERRFGLRSSQTGLVAGGYDMASFICLAPVTYLGGRQGASKPRWIGLGALLMGLGSMVFALPHFVSSTYSLPGDSDSACHRVTNITSVQAGCDSSEGSGSAAYLLVFLAAQFLHGAGASPLFTLGVTYIDENVSKKMSSVYIGIFYTMSIIGPAVGYVLGGQLLQIYTDFLFVDHTELGLTPDSNVWIGAWWIGFLLSALLCFTISLPLMAFPPALPGSAELQKEKVSEAYDGDASRTEAFTKVRELPRAFLVLMKNPTFCFLNLAGATEGMLLSGFAAFLPKLIENQFSITASWAAILMGMVTVPAGGGGTFLGGYLVKRLQLQCAGIIRLCVWSTFLTVLFSGGFILSCPNLAFAGLTQPYGHSTHKAMQTISLDSSCNQGCSCSRSVFDPVCGIDGVMYYSPCYAGCSEETSVQGSTAYNECTCIKPALKLQIQAEHSNKTANGLNKNVTAPMSYEYSSSNVPYEAINTMCDSGCSYLYVFLILIFFTMLFTFITTMPALSATLRCVRDDQRSFALGIQWIKVRLLGTIPAPLIFGILIDESCLLWQQSCDGKGACLVYNNMFMSRYMLALALIVKAGSLLFFFLAWWFYKAPQQNKMAAGGKPAVSSLQADARPNNHGHYNGCVVNDNNISEHL